MPTIARVKDLRGPERFGTERDYFSICKVALPRGSMRDQIDISVASSSPLNAHFFQALAKISQIDRLEIIEYESTHWTKHLFAKLVVMSAQINHNPTGETISDITISFVTYAMSSNYQ